MSVSAVAYTWHFIWDLEHPGYTFYGNPKLSLKKKLKIKNQIQVFTTQWATRATCRKIIKNGSSRIFVRNWVEYTALDVESFYSHSNVGICAIKLLHPQLEIIPLIRSPPGDIQIIFKL